MFLCSPCVRKTPKWLGVYFEIYVGFSRQTNPSGITGFGFSKNSFDIGITTSSGKISTAIAVGLSWKETYIQASLIFSSKKGRYFFSINFKLAIMHWFTIGAAALCYCVPAFTPIVSYIVKLFGASTRVAKPLLPIILPVLLKT